MLNTSFSETSFFSGAQTADPTCEGEESDNTTPVNVATTPVIVQTTPVIVVTTPVVTTPVIVATTPTPVVAVTRAQCSGGTMIDKDILMDRGHVRTTVWGRGPAYT